MNITTFNVNSIRARLDHLLAWIDDREPDVLCLQELKCMDADLPRAEFERRGYHVESFGQKTYNGVAILSRSAITEVATDLPWAGDPQARGIAGTVRGIRIVNLYVVNGQDTESEKYLYKLDWLRKLREYLAGVTGVPLLVCGDFNIAPTDADVHDPAAWKGQVLCTQAEREAFAGICALGLTDAYRKIHPERRQFTWWDYRGNGFDQNKGVRIDHHLVSQDLMPRVLDVTVDMDERATPQASDHAPVTLHLA